MGGTHSSQSVNCCGPGCREHVLEGAATHYDEKYFRWQRKHGLSTVKGRDYMRLTGARHTDTVLDFGAGTGAILRSLNVSHRVAVEFNPSARAFMSNASPHVETHQFPEQVSDNSVDLVFSTAVIEHVECPIQELRELRKKLKPSGRIVLGIKNEGVELWQKWRPGNIDNHLYTWNSMLLGNVLRAAGFIVDHIRLNPWSLQNLPSTESKKRAKEKLILDNRFGARAHTFQLIYAYGHVPTASEAFPQKHKAELLL